MVIAQVHTNLFEAASRDERCDCVSDRTQAAHGQASRHGDHALLCDAAVVEAIGKLRFELVEHAVADVTTEQHDAIIAGGKEFEL